jgi:hypothetical protein
MLPHRRPRAEPVRRALPAAGRWLDDRRRPQGWSCTQPRGTLLKLHCTRGKRTLFVIRR